MHTKHIEAETRRRCSDWLEGNRRQLWAPQLPGSEEREDRASTVKARMQRARDLLGENLLQQACGALVSEPPVAVTADVVAELRQKHPMPADDWAADLPRGHRPAQP